MRRAPGARLARRIAIALVLALLAPACAGAPPSMALPPPSEATTLGVGDVFEVRIVGEEKLPTTFTVAPDGSVDLPYINRIQARGLEPQQLAQQVRDKLMQDKILSNPSVSVSIKEYNSKRVEVIGEVQRPGSLPLQPGMTLLRAISIAGGFNSIANKSRVTVRRRVRGGGTAAATISVEDIINNKLQDPLLQSGDSINVEQRVF